MPTILFDPLPPEGGQRWREMATCGVRSVGIPAHAVWRDDAVRGSVRFGVSLRRSRGQECPRSFSIRCRRREGNGGGRWRPVARGAWAFLPTPFGGMGRAGGAVGLG